MLNAITKTIDVLVEKQGQLTSFLIVPLLFIVLYEVLMRYAFNAPTVPGGSRPPPSPTACTTCSGCRSWKMPKGHVRVDIVTNLLSQEGSGHR
jgi:TRAP-type C4-dicarboxylate transport system permease small subunit